MNNYTEKQIKLAGLVQPDGGAREFEQGLDLQGEGIRVLQNDRTIFEENTGDCCEDLQTCELAINACEAEKVELEQEISDLEDEIQDLEDQLGSPASLGGLAYDDPGRGQWYVYATGLYASYNIATEIITYGGTTIGTIIDDPRISGAAGPVFYGVYPSGFRQLLNYGSTAVGATVSSTNVFEYSGHLSYINGDPLSHVEVDLNLPLTGYSGTTKVTITFT
jgi:hypothetical protein